MPSLERRYAEALCKAAGEDKASDIYYKIKALSDLLEENGELKKFIENPVIPSRIKKQTLDKIILFEADATVKNFIYLLIDNKRTGLLAEILKFLYTLLPENRGKLFIKIFTSVQLNEEVVNKLSEKYKAAYGCAEAESEIIIDKSLMGGICVQIGDMRYDGTLKAKMKKLREKLT